MNNVLLWWGSFLIDGRKKYVPNVKQDGQVAHEEIGNIRGLSVKDTNTWMMSLFKEGENYGTTTNR